MGAGKTQAVLEFCTDWIKRGLLKNVTYLGPWRVLVKSVGDRVELLNKSGPTSGKCNMAGIKVVQRYFGGRR